MPTKIGINLFTEEELAVLDRRKTPQSIAFIPDGNRRWAEKNGVSVRKGHEMGAKNIIQTVRAAQELGVKEITFYIFSTENWARKKTEIQTLFYLFDTYLEKKREEMIQQGVRFFTIGDLSRLPSILLQNIAKTKLETAIGSTIDVIFAVNYGGRDEICRAVRALLDDFEQHKVKKTDVTESLLSQYMDTVHFTDPELMIRTSGEQRMSNFLLWQSCYAEWEFCPKLWPDFLPEDLYQIFSNFQKRERRIGA